MYYADVTWVRDRLRNLAMRKKEDVGSRVCKGSYEFLYKPEPETLNPKPRRVLRWKGFLGLRVRGFVEG